MTKYKEQLKSVIDDCKIKNLKDIKPVVGGDINQTFFLDADDQYFLKVNDSTLYPEMFLKEVNGLNTLRGISNCYVPEVINHGKVEGKQYLLLEWLEKGNPPTNFWETFGVGVAHTHQRTQSNFGFVEDNFIGSLHQSNNLKSSWSEFYSENRILPLVRQLINSNSLPSSLTHKVESLCTRLDDFFPKEKPALLHGDLWSGNFMIAENGKPTIYDPAVYFGHREMDLGMTLLFGGFDSRFYNSYNDTYPLEKSWKERIALTQLYPLLVHAILFGSGYVQQVVSIINRFG